MLTPSKPIPAKSFDEARGNQNFRQDAKHHETNGDNRLEQHPANQWLMLSDQGKQAFRLSERSELETARKEKGRKKATKKEALFTTVAPIIEDEVENEKEQTPEEPAIMVDEDDEDPHENAAEQPLDEHGCAVPRKRGRGKAAAPNNRIIAPSLVTYDDDEIGQRQHVFKNINGERVDVGRDANPTPKNLYLNQVVSNHNSAKNKPGDLDQNLVDSHKVHPIFGVPIKDSINPDYEHLEDVTFAPGVMFIETDKNGQRKVIQTSRSAWIDHTYKTSDKISKLIHLRQNFKDRAIQDGFYEKLDLEDRPDQPVAPVAPVAREKQVIDPALIAAAQDALEEVRKAAVAAPPQLVASSPMVSTPQRTQQYDPVRDSTRTTTYQTPYGQAGNFNQSRFTQRQPFSHSVDRLGELADAASRAAPLPVMRNEAPQPSMMPSFERSNNPFSHPPAMHATGPMQTHMAPPFPPQQMPPQPVPPQSMMYGPPPHQQYQSAPYYITHHSAPQYQPSQPPPHVQFQQQSPHMGHAPASGSGLRELRPAVAKSRQPQPPPPPPPAPGWNPYGAPPGAQR